MTIFFLINKKMAFLVAEHAKEEIDVKLISC